MTEVETAASGGGLLAFLGFLRWAVGLWATVRREDIAATTARATADREADSKQSDRQVAAIDRMNATVSEHTARDIAAQADVKAAVVRMEATLDERARAARAADPPSERKRKQTHPTGVTTG